MSEEKEIIQKLVERIDELLVILNRVADDLQQISTTLKSIAISQMPPQPTPTPPSPLPTPISIPKTLEKAQTLEEIKMTFPEDLENLLNFEEKEDVIIIKPRQFLGPENFAKIASLVRGIGGEYISAGKSSHFKVPKRKV